nr:MAG TPA: PBP-dependent ABC transporter [Caudoviricetes sp.]
MVHKLNYMIFFVFFPIFYDFKRKGVFIEFRNYNA